MQRPCGSEDHGMIEKMKEAGWAITQKRRKIWTRTGAGVGDSHRALWAPLPLLKRQIWGRAGQDGAGGVCWGRSMESLAH